MPGSTPPAAAPAIEPATLTPFTEPEPEAEPEPGPGTGAEPEPEAVEAALPGREASLLAAVLLAGLGFYLLARRWGIGRLLALRMAAAGGRLALIDRRERELEALAEEIRAGGGEAVAMVCDVGDREQALATADRAVDAVIQIVARR